MKKISFTSSLRFLCVLSALALPLFLAGCSKPEAPKTTDELKTFQGNPDKIREGQAKADAERKAAGIPSR